MRELVSKLFESENGKKIYSAAELAIEKYGMADLISGGVIVGFSGGADSVMLLSVLLHYRSRRTHFPILAVHINHMIRGDEALRDEEFAKKLCHSLRVDFRAIRIDVPALADSERRGVEEVARDARYAAFRAIACENGGYSAISVAHNATDNLETMMFNMMRGAGLNGMAGISPVRDNIVRPLIYSSKDEIREALDAISFPYVIDSTNFSVEYTRNYIRNEIIPKLSHISIAPEKMAMRVSENLNDDSDFIESAAKNFIAEKFIDGKAQKKALASIHKALLFRILAYMMRQYCKNAGEDKFFIPEKTHVDVIYSKLRDGDFCYCLPGGVTFVSSGEWCFLKKTGDSVFETDEIPVTRLSLGLNFVSGYSSVVLLSENDDLTCYSNVYKTAIYAQIPCDIIDGKLYLRSKNDGDSYSYGGLTRKLKKLFCDSKIPQDMRMKIPVFCDNSGVLWVPGFGVRSVASKRDVSGRKALYIYILEPKEDDPQSSKFFIK